MDDLNEKLLSDIAELAKNDKEGPGGIIESLANLADSAGLDVPAEDEAPAEIARDVSHAKVPEDNLEEAFSLISEEKLSEEVKASINSSPELERIREITGGDVEDYSEEEEEAKEAKRKKKNILYNLMMVACIGVFVYCVGRIGVYYYTGWKYRQSLKKLTDVVGDISHDVLTPEVKVVTETDIFFPDELVYAEETPVQYVDEVSDTWNQKYASLVEVNSDCVGWLQIPDTQINYPVMYTPNDVEKYLYKNFEGQYLFRGLPFMSEGTLLNRSQNYIIYGHNMNDGSAFNNLRNYLDYNWTMEHPYCYFNTAYAEGIYQVMDVVLTKIYTVEDECFKYYRYAGELTEDEFNTYSYYMKQLSRFDTGVEAVWGDQLLTLSTCYRVYDPEGRLVIVFKRIQ